MKKSSFSSLGIILCACLLTGCIGGLGREAALQGTREALEGTQTAMAEDPIEPDQVEEAATETLPPASDTPSPMLTPSIPTLTEPPTIELPTFTPVILIITTTPQAIDTPTPTEPINASGGPTFTPTSVLGMETIRVENFSGQPFKITLVCSGGPCVGKSPSTYNFSYPKDGTYYFQVWSGRYNITWTICGKTTSFVHALNGRWYIRLNKCK